jgi:hypothetical protein
VRLQVLMVASMKSSGLLHCVVWWNFTSVSEMLAVSIIRAIGKLLPDYMAQQPRRQRSLVFILSMGKMRNMYKIVSEN